jgi:hypothetical protein
MRKRIVGIFTCILLMVSSLALTPATVAHWAPGDDHKMHFPQEPDLDGWDVHATHYIYEDKGIELADDFKCTQTGYITDIHFWGSWYNDWRGYIYSFTIRIWSNIPEDQNPDGYSKPGVILKEWTFRTWGEVPRYYYMEGWYDPCTSEYEEWDHYRYYQYNIVGIDDTDFRQTSGEIYWLSITANVFYPSYYNYHWGWKNADLDEYPYPYTGKPYEDNAVYRCDGGGWEELYDPITDKGLDLSFVIDGRWPYIIWRIPDWYINPDIFQPARAHGGGNWYTSYLPGDELCLAEDMDASTILLEDSIQPVLNPKYGFVKSKESYLMDYDGDGEPDRMLKFWRDDLEDIFDPGTYNMKISGLLVNGTAFEGYSETVTMKG